MSRVLLLRTPTADGPDRYETAFETRGYRPISVPVLETTYTNLDHLKTKVLEGPGKHGYNGVVITSGRSCEAWKTVTLELAEDDPDIDEEHSAAWANVPFYVVGEATEKALFQIREIVGKYPSVPRDIRGARDAGTSERLAHLILKDLSSDSKEGKRLLYLTGDKNRDTLPSILTDEGISLDSLQVYETRGSTKFADDLQKALYAFSGHVPHLRLWIVFFAPSDAQYATPMLREHFHLPAATDTPEVASKPVPQIAAIGPTTATSLREDLHLSVHIVSPKPNAASLAQAVLEYDNEQ
ncbi:tetrapyrrole biosynthesis uroporphyrinogen III synthase [Wolfiporia cocos MD-104 SS10]|uniref:Tetrapyrrole biosynthesis uroporphyrinogen III synthase n=1 Tax=Wolfiporia cocos (strain MD-104) TaxID=742152 RepID=A0A2H3K1K2_WOLCO|nr:tetrapyrrole biosynthesis uroporphyrinogen III synthase [Wolfiporia cocos MD-104 SS10]